MLTSIPTKSYSIRDLYSIDENLKCHLETVLKTAIPNKEKLYKLIKLIKSENRNLDASFIEQNIIDFYTLPFHLRSANQLQRRLNVEVYPWLHQQFLLNFKQVSINATAAHFLSVKLKFLIEQKLFTSTELSSTDIILPTSWRLLKPQADDLDSGLGFYEFCIQWNKIAFKRFGSKYEDLFGGLFKDLELLQKNQFFPDIALNPEDEETNIDLRQLDLDWLKDILLKMDKGQLLPPYPLSRGPNKPELLKLEEIVRTLNTCMELGQSATPAFRKLIGHLSQSCRSFLNLYSQLDRIKTDRVA